MNADFKIKHKLTSAANYKAQGKYLHAIQICEMLLSEFPYNPNIIFELVELYELSGNLNSSFLLLEDYLENNPSDMDVRLFYGQNLLKNKLWQKAIEIFSKLIPEEKPISLFFLGYSYFMIKDFELARINYLSFLSLEEDRELVYETYIFLAKIEIELNDFEQALVYAKQSELLYKSYWELHLIYAICYYNLGMDTHAVLSVEKSIKLNPKSISSYEWAGKIFLRSGDYLKAEEYFSKFIESAEEISSETYLGLAQVYVHNKKIQPALDYFDLVLKIDPNNKNALMWKKNISRELQSKISKDAK